MEETAIRPKLSFDNTEIAFGNKDDKALRRAYRLFSMMSYPWLSVTGSQLAAVALKIGLPIKGMVRNTIYQQFVGGETLQKSLPTIDGLAAASVLTVLDYGVEAKTTEADYDATAEEIKREILFAKDKDSIPYVSCKVTGFAHFPLLEQLHAGKPLAEKEQAEWQRVKDRLHSVAQLAYQHKVGLYVDAEETWIQQPIDDLVTELMETYNKEQVIVSNTIQLYRHDRLAYLKRAVAAAEAGGYLYGIKLVRGAYMEKERARAEKLGYPSPIQPDKAATDRDFNEAVRFCIDNYHRVAVCVATHNEESNRLLAELVEERGIDRQHPHIFACQLLGMSDHITFNLADAGFRAGKYIPYGPVDDVVPYLSRRARENTSVGGQMSRELQLLKREMQRRKL